MQARHRRPVAIHGELFAADDVDGAMVAAGIGVDPATVRHAWDGTGRAVLAEATLSCRTIRTSGSAAAAGFHTEHLGHLLGEMQWMQRTYPGLEW